MISEARAAMVYFNLIIMFLITGKFTEKPRRKPRRKHISGTNTFKSEWVDKTFGKATHISGYTIKPIQTYRAWNNFTNFVLLLLTMFMLELLLITTIFTYPGFTLFCLIFSLPYGYFKLIIYILN